MLPILVPQVQVLHSVLSAIFNPYFIYLFYSILIFMLLICNFCTLSC